MEGQGWGRKTSEIDREQNMTNQQNNPGLLEKISGLSKEKIINTIKQREKSHIEVLKECSLVGKNNVKEITDSVLSIGWGTEDQKKVNTEFFSVCHFVLDIDNPWVDDLFALISGSDVEENWKNLTKNREVKPSKYYKGKPYEIFSCNCREPACATCRDRDSQQKKLRNQISGYFPYKREQQQPKLDTLQECIHQLQMHCNHCWENGEEFGGFCKGKDWEVPYVFGTEKMKEILLRHLNDFPHPVSESKECFDTTVEQAREKLVELGFEFRCIKVSGNPVQVDGETGMKDKEKEILMEMEELVNKPLNKSDIMRTLTKHSVGILLWQNHCQATVTCIGKDLVLAPAHIFQQDKSEIWDHLLLMYCEKVLEDEDARTNTFCNLREKGHTCIKENLDTMDESFKKFIGEFEKTKQKNQSEDAFKEFKAKSEAAIRVMQVEIERLCKIKEEQLVTLKPEEMKIHIGYTEDVHDHFRENCCKYFVNEVILINHKLDFSLLKVKESQSFKGSKELSAKQNLVPMVLSSKDSNMHHVYVASHPFNRTLSIENFVKLLCDDEKRSFVENFHIRAITQAIAEDKDTILRHTSKSFLEKVPNKIYLHKYETDGKTKQLIKRSYSEGGIPGSHSNEMEADRPTHKKLLVSVESLKDGRWHSYSLRDFWHCDIPKRKNLQIPIPAAKDGTNNPYRIIITSRQEQVSFACEIEENGGDDKQGILRIQKLDYAIVVEENPTNSVFLSLVSDESNMKKIKCAIKDEKLVINDGSPEADKKGTIAWKTINSLEFKTDLPAHVLRVGESCHLPEISLTLRNKNLHYSIKEKNAQPRCILCLEETIFKLELEVKKENNVNEDEVKKEKDTDRNGKAVNEDKVNHRVVKIEVDEKEIPLNIDTSQSNTRQRRYTQRQRKECIHFKNIKDGIIGIILMKIKSKKGHHGDKNFSVISECDTSKESKSKKKCQEDRYCSVKIKLDSTSESFKYKYKADWLKSRKLTLTEGDTGESYLVWPTDSLSSNFELRFQKKGKPCITLSLILYSDSHRVVEFDPDGRKSHGCLLRQVSAPGNPRESTHRNPPEIARLEKISPFDEKQRFVKNLFTSFSNAEQKKLIINEDILTEGRKKYIGSDDKFEHLKLIDMEYGASGGACCFLDDQGQVTLHGMFLGACPPFYYNNEDLKHFFNKTGTCFNKILPSKKIKDILEKQQKSGALNQSEDNTQVNE
ncbi:uncharacterized protein LOC133196130 [Saccostrea echinata]|uniref:uncharacterized protein LOC133196130 n=1 Tax=Saccostrea echinata TaxID=191078 RepID=UPI002A82A988|nr:uncharacterized protein LOC133196130 [Saccostrea echinata]